jgi:hypothetical protein
LIAVWVQVNQHALELASDTYGNYVVQHSLQHGSHQDRSAQVTGKNSEKCSKVDCDSFHEAMWFCCHNVILLWAMLRFS